MVKFIFAFAEICECLFVHAFTITIMLCNHYVIHYLIITFELQFLLRKNLKVFVATLFENVPIIVYNFILYLACLF